MLNVFKSVIDQLKAARRERTTAQQERAKEAVRTGTRLWHCAGFRDVRANTKSEARAKFKQQMREEESLSFHPAKAKRLPAGKRVTEIV